MVDALFLSLSLVPLNPNPISRPPSRSVCESRKKPPALSEPHYAQRLWRRNLAPQATGFRHTEAKLCLSAKTERIYTMGSGFQPGCDFSGRSRHRTPHTSPCTLTLPKQIGGQTQRTVASPNPSPQRHLTGLVIVRPIHLSCQESIICTRKGKILDTRWRAGATPLAAPERSPLLTRRLQVAFDLVPA